MQRYLVRRLVLAVPTIFGITVLIFIAMRVGPVIALGLVLAAGLARMTRSTILEALFDDYVRTARSKGPRERAVVGRHVMRNALLPW